MTDNLRPATHSRRAIFLDRDGVISVNRSDYVKSWSEFSFLPRALDALRRLAATQFIVAVTTNQSAVARGLVDNDALREIHGRMLARIQHAGGRIDSVYYCPHKPGDGCDCRKPKPGMYQRAARELGIDLTQSIVIGDAIDDIAAAQTIGAQPILVLTGRGQAQHEEMTRNNHAGYVIVDDLFAAVDLIAREENIVL